MERNFGTSEIIEYMREGATLRRRPATSQVILTLPDGQTYSVPIGIADSLVDQHQIKEGDDGVFKLAN
jgi:hypothetical protein